MEMSLNQSNAKLKDDLVFTFLLETLLKINVSPPLIMQNGIKQGVPIKYFAELVLINFLLLLRPSLPLYSFSRETPCLLEPLEIPFLPCLL